MLIFFNKNINIDNELNQKKDTFFNDIAIFLYLIIGGKIHFFKKKGEKHEKKRT